MVLGLLQGLLHQVRDHWAPILWLNLPLDLHVRRHLRPGRRLSVLLGLVLILAWIGQELWVDQWRTQEAESGGLGWLAVGPGLLWTGAVLLQTGHPPLQLRSRFYVVLRAPSISSPALLCFIWFLLEVRRGFAKFILSLAFISLRDGGKDLLQRSR